MSDLIESEVLIIGCGIGGGTAALTLADAGVPVTVVTRGKAPEAANTYWAQGGIIYEGVKDSPDLLVEDILRAGAGHCYEPAVRQLAEEGQIFLRSTNPSGARGDGLAMAYRAGVRIINAEFVQFHPTAFYAQDAARFLISEAVRGAGARLVHANGEPFMQRYEPTWKDLAPRDVVARSIHREMLENDVPNVYLDLRNYVSKEEILQHFPTIHAECLKFGMDATRELVPVVPAAHYFCGGIWVDRWVALISRTSMPPVKSLVPVCMEPTGWRVPPCSKAWCGVNERHSTSWTVYPLSHRPMQRTSPPGSIWEQNMATQL
jgi:aspartate oxidase